DDADERALPRRQLARHLPCEMADAEALEAFRGGSQRIGHAVEVAEHAQHLDDTHAIGEREVAGREADTRHGLAAFRGQGMAQHLDRACIRRDDAEQHQQGGGLARAVGAEQRHPFAGAHDQVDTVDRPLPAERLLERARFQGVPHERQLWQRYTDGSRPFPPRDRPCMRVLALVDGEHYPPVVRSALESAPATVVGAALLGGIEKLTDPTALPDLGVPVVTGPTPDAALLEGLRRFAPDLVLDLADQPVVDARVRMRLAARALAAGVPYQGADFRFDPPPPPPIPAKPVGGRVRPGPAPRQTPGAPPPRRHPP